MVSKDETKMLLVCKHILECLPFNDWNTFDITWENCTIRAWMNGEFKYDEKSSPDYFTEEEVSICGLKTPISSIKEVVLFPISGNMKGLGGCIKFVTEDNPELPVLNEQRGWDVVFQGEVNSGFDLARGNCFWYGGDYSENGWKEQNAKAEEIVEHVKSMLL